MSSFLHRLSAVALLSLFSCPGAETPNDGGVPDDGGTTKSQTWVSEREGACQVFLNLDQGAFILAQLCAADAGTRIGMASQGTFTRQSETLTLLHSLSTCTATFTPGTSLVAKHESPALILPLQPKSVSLTFRADAGSSLDGGTPTTLGCLELDGGFTPHPWQ